MTQRLLIPIFFIIIIITSVKSSPNENCKFANTKGTPCILITIPNSNKISKSISSKTVITRDQIRENNLIDLPSVLKYVNGINLSQSGSVGQQTSVFMRGTNSNHVLVLLNGIPINDQSKTSGQYDFGQDFMYNISQVEIYKGSSGAHFGSDAIGGAINFVTNVDFNNNLSLTSRSDSKTVQGNYTKIIDDWQINFQGGHHKSQIESALKNGTDKDGAENKSLGINIVKWLNDNLRFRSNLFSRNTLTDLDGHTLSLQHGFDANDEMYAFQTAFDYNTKNTKNYITLHTHEYNRDYSSPNSEFDEYNSNSYVLRSEHSKKQTEKFTYGIGFEYKYDKSSFSNRGSSNSSLSGNYDNNGFFGNASYELSENFFATTNLRYDENKVVGKNNSYKIGILKEDFFKDLNLSLSHSTSFKNPSLYQLYGAANWGYSGNRNLNAEQSTSNEINFDYKVSSNSKINFTIFENEISDVITFSGNTYINNDSDKLKQKGAELFFNVSDKINKIVFYSSNLSSKKLDGTSQLRRPNWKSGVNYKRALDKNLSIITNYEYISKHFDVHNTNFTTITMPKVHLLDVSIVKDFYGLKSGIKINNLLNKNYEGPHGFSKNDRNLYFFINKNFN